MELAKLALLQVKPKRRHLNHKQGMNRIWHFLFSYDIQMFLLHVVLLVYIFLASILKIKVPEFALIIGIFIALALVVYDPVISVLLLMAILVMRLNMTDPKEIPSWRTQLKSPSPYLGKDAKKEITDSTPPPVPESTPTPTPVENSEKTDSQKTLSHEILTHVLGDRLPTKEQLESAQTNVWNAKNMNIYINDLAQASKKGSYGAQGTSSKTDVWGYDPMSEVF